MERSWGAPARARAAGSTRRSRSGRSSARGRCAGVARSRANTRTAARAPRRRAASRRRSPPSRRGSPRSPGASRRAARAERSWCRSSASAARVGAGSRPSPAPAPWQRRCRGARPTPRSAQRRRPSDASFPNDGTRRIGGAFSDDSKVRARSSSQRFRRPPRHTYHRARSSKEMPASTDPAPAFSPRCGGGRSRRRGYLHKESDSPRRSSRGSGLSGCVTRVRARPLVDAVRLRNRRQPSGTESDAARPRASPRSPRDMCVSGAGVGGATRPCLGWRP